MTLLSISIPVYVLKKLKKNLRSIPIPHPISNADHLRSFVKFLNLSFKISNT